MTWKLWWSSKLKIKEEITAAAVRSGKSMGYTGDIYCPTETVGYRINIKEYSSANVVAYRAQQQVDVNSTCTNEYVSKEEAAICTTVLTMGIH